MLDEDRFIIDRRGFLTGAMALVGAAMVGITPGDSSAALASVAQPVAHASSIALWNGGFINPANAGGDVSLLGKDVFVTVHGHNAPKSSNSILGAIKFHYAVNIDGVVTQVPFYAWAASPPPPGNPRVKVPVGPNRGLVISVEIDTKPVTEEYYFLTVDPVAGDAKLRCGTYALAAGSPSWTGHKLVGGGTKIYPADFEYLLLTVAEA